MDVKDAQQWYKDGIDILKFKEKLNNIAANKIYSNDFEDIYYGESRAKSATDILEACSKLALKGVANLSSLKEKEIVRDFISISKLAVKEDLRSFWNLLRVNGWLPVDPVIARQRAEEAERRRQFEELMRRQRIKAKKERLRRTRLRIFKWAGWIGAFLLVVFMLVRAVPYYQYHYAEYNALLQAAEEYVLQDKYDEALIALQDARSRKSGKKKIQEVDELIANVKKTREEKIQKLQTDMTKVWDAYFIKRNGRISNTLNISVIRYVKREDIKSVIEDVSLKLELLKNIFPENNIHNEHQNKLNILKKYYKL